MTHPHSPSTRSPKTKRRAVTARGAGPVATFVTLSGELAVYGRPLLAASGQFLMAAHSRPFRVSRYDRFHRDLVAQE